MTHRPAKNRTSQACLLGGRILTLLTLILVVIMPLTEYLWHFDQFMRGGQDFELGLLSMMTFLCLMLVLFQHGKSSITFRMALRRWIASVFRKADPGTPGAMCGLITPIHVIPFPSASLRLYNLPQQV